MTFPALLASLERTRPGELAATVPATWMQGRTTYGGLTAALCHEAARELGGGAPLRSAQVAFIGPVGGRVSVAAAILRTGRSSAFVGADLFGEDGSLAARTLFVFGARRESALVLDAMPAMPDVPGPDALPGFFGGGPAPEFARNFETALAFGPRPVTGASTADIGLWMRHLDRRTPDDMTAILAIGDAPPPAALSLFAQPGRISSMTWSMDILADTLQTMDGWWFARHTAETAAHGYSSQAMTLWNRSGTPIMTGRQTIALFN